MLKRLIKMKIREEKKNILSTILNNKYFYKKNDKKKYHIKYMDDEIFLLKYYGLNRKGWFYVVLEYSSLIFEINNDIIIDKKE